jgi:hypothetical protein
MLLPRLEVTFHFLVYFVSGKKTSSAFFRAEDVDIRIHLPCIIDAIILFQWVAGG